MPRFSSTLLLLVVAVAASAFIVDTCAADGDSSRRLLASGCKYTIQAGDTYWILAQRRGTTVGAIQSLNPGVDPNRLQIGQVINVPCSGGGSTPTSTTPAARGCKYTIQAGDTYWILAQRRGTTVGAIQSLNPGVDPNRLQIGQVINVPCSGGGSTPTSTTPAARGCKYTIQAGDTYWILAQRRRTTVGAIQSLNPGVDPNSLQIGQVINVPC
ncbi:hypothetical protein VOLCADRAFT_107633 [Volvox carteri f. nagariensis]|uniref:LysM domain-containing protein n=1 Tax=Volvox carteri f. nagariensis TaxID=3068 RepID=D8UFB4_VOLCA|nr:uncharacterized protein VOLCADRAFT_107633 [Volvox carteri f. nagariensis]EFJ41577.1 hypothetical protein VOLCADRAFT_107633 [Volvox carteri f. nagariensis]|eukprot:XP_002957368.1 hypothetical protein VOLCADRAFT_107633 [Volvox carteri f. nagariensis]